MGENYPQTELIISLQSSIQEDTTHASKNMDMAKPYHFDYDTRNTLHEITYSSNITPFYPLIPHHIQSHPPFYQ